MLEETGVPEENPLRRGENVQTLFFSSVKTMNETVDTIKKTFNSKSQAISYGPICIP